MDNQFYEYAQSVSKEKKKQLGIVYTPYEIVDYINTLTLSMWDSKNGIPKVVDPCCGTGVFLHDMVCKISEKWSISYEEVCEKYVYGYDLDPDALKICSENLPGCKLIHGNSLAVDYSEYDIIVTNPPYIRIQNLNETTRTFIKKSFEYCDGDTDIYIAFLEKFFKSKKIVGLICPNSWIRNKGTTRLRNTLYDNRSISELIDFKDRFIFDDVQAYTSIVAMSPKASTHLSYSNCMQEPVVKINYTHSSSNRIFSGLQSISNSKNNNLLNYCDIKVGLATLCDGIYFGEVLGPTDGDLCNFKTKYGTFSIELSALRKCVKASKLSNIKENTYIIFPYDHNNKLLKESMLKNKYPLTYQYLLDHKGILLARDKGKIDKNNWYGYGRTQGLSNNREKLLIPPMHKDKLSLRYSSEDELYISGYAIFPKDGTSFSEICSMFESTELFDWIKSGGKTFSGGWYGVSKQLFKDYIF